MYSSLNESLGSIFDMLNIHTLENHSLFKWSPKNAFKEDIESPYDYQQNSTII